MLAGLVDVGFARIGFNDYRVVLVRFRWRSKPVWRNLAAKHRSVGFIRDALLRQPSSLNRSSTPGPSPSLIKNLDQKRNGQPTQEAQKADLGQGPR